jgi:tRNA pseudouridine38-40 synthase
VTGDFQGIPSKEPLTGFRVRFRVAYLGTGFYGWQIQPGRRTVQGVLKSKLSFLLGREVVPVGAGRTDRGVHARGQVAHLNVNTEDEVERLGRALPGLMPPDIKVSDVRKVPLEFHSRFSATARRYSFHLLFKRDIFHPNNWQLLRPLDREAMDQAAACFPGTRDCTSFCKTSSTKAAGNVCQIDHCAFEWSEDSAIFHVRANRFLHHMVRIMVGTLVEVGMGHRRPDEIPAILEALNRSSAGKMAPPEGLFLEEVYYPEGDGS